MCLWSFSPPSGPLLRPFMRQRSMAVSKKKIGKLGGFVVQHRHGDNKSSPPPAVETHSVWSHPLFLLSRGHGGAHPVAPFGWEHSVTILPPSLGYVWVYKVLNIFRLRRIFGLTSIFNFFHTRLCEKAIFFYVPPNFWISKCHFFWKDLKVSGNDGFLEYDFRNSGQTNSNPCMCQHYYWCIHRPLVKHRLLHS